MSACRAAALTTVVARRCRNVRACARQGSPCDNAQPQRTEQAQAEENMLVEQLCSELLPCSSCTPAASSCLRWCQHNNNTAAPVAAAALAGLLQGCGSTDATAAALAGLFPAASTFLVSLPWAPGTCQLVIPLPRPASAGRLHAMDCCNAPAPLRPALGASARCTLVSAAPIAPAERQLLAEFARELGRLLGPAVKEVQEAAYERLSEALQRGSVPNAAAVGAPAFAGSAASVVDFKALTSPPSLLASWLAALCAERCLG